MKVLKIAGTGCGGLIVVVVVAGMPGSLLSKVSIVSVSDVPTAIPTATLVLTPKPTPLPSNHVQLGKSFHYDGAGNLVIEQPTQVFHFADKIAGIVTSDKTMLAPNGFRVIVYGPADATNQHYQTYIDTTL